MNSTFTLAHISDLHFSHGAYHGGTHQHSIQRLRGIQQVLSGVTLDRLIVSGDITNGGDPDSLLRARDWLFDSFSISGSEAIGLKMSPESVGLVPGNHDAYNLPSDSASILGYWQKSLSNYNEVFSGHQFSHPDSCRYDWIEKNGRAVFIVYVDTSFVGDPELERKSSKHTHLLTRIPKIARGKMRKEQSGLIFEWFYHGVTGKLLYPGDSSRYIPRELFAASLKILVAHHYLFEPRGSKIEKLLEQEHTHSVFVDIASADFDLYLCGHKHLDDQDRSTYGKRLDRKGKGRHLLNLFRRMVGIEMLPLEIRDEQGKKWPSAYAFGLGVLWLKEKTSPTISGIQDEAADGRFVAEFVTTLQSSLQQPAALEKEVRNFLKQYKLSPNEVVSSDELREIQRRLKSQFSAQERKQLELLGEKIQGIARKLNSRPFLQIMAGSSAKESNSSDKKRSFNIYEIVAQRDRYDLIVRTYVWDPSLLMFSQNPETSTYRFNDSDRFIV